MKLATADTEALVSGGASQGQFAIKASAKAFQILSGGLYSDKILAIVRELSCNAWDSHKEAGTDKSFLLQLPNSLNAEFRIRDYGIGLDHEGITQVYTTYFESTKQDSNDYVGALGLGSKSPFSYTKNFSVIAWKGGVQRTYSAFVDGEGFPNFVLLDQIESDEPNGVEVKFAVERDDFWKFKEATQKVFKWFPVGAADIKGSVTITPQEMKHTAIVPGVDIRTGSGVPFARQGVVVYPMTPNADDIDKDLRPLLKVPFVIDFDIGSLDVAASREELSYIDHTNKSINTRLREVQNGLEAYVKRELSAAKTDWEKLLTMHQMRDDTFKVILLSMFEGKKRVFSSIETGESSYGTPNIMVHVDTAWDISKYSVKTRNHGTGEVKLQRQQASPVYSAPGKDGNKTMIGQVFNVYAPDTTIFLNDTGKRNVLGRVRLYCKDNDHKRNIVVVAPTTPASLKKLQAAFGQAPMIECSDLDEPARYGTKVASNTRISLLKLKKRPSGSGSYYTANDSWMWVPEVTSVADACKDDKGVVQETIYVPLKNRIVLAPNGQEFNKEDFFYFMDNCKSAGLIKENFTCYGVRKSVIDELTSDYISLFDWIKKKLSAISVKKIAEYSKRQALAGKSIFMASQLERMTEVLGPKHVVAELAALIKDADKCTGLESPSLRHYISRTATVVGMKVDFDEPAGKAHKEGTTMWGDFVEAYPMLEYFSVERDRRCITAAIDYIKLVDEAA